MTIFKLQVKFLYSIQYTAGILFYHLAEREREREREREKTTLRSRRPCEMFWQSIKPLIR